MLLWKNKPPVNLNRLPAGGDLVNPIEAKVEEALNKVLVPGIMRSLVQMNLVRSAEIDDGRAKVTLATTAISVQHHKLLTDQVTAAIGRLPEVKEVSVDFVEVKPKELNQITRLVAIMSGKGGVGKSLVASLLATYFAREGEDVGILDADITGPSIPKMFGLSARPSGNETGILPITSKSGIEIMSMNLLLPSPVAPIMCRWVLRSSGVI